jgi:Flp pilus assembly protein TadD
MSEEDDSSAIEKPAFRPEDLLPDTAPLAEETKELDPAVAAASQDTAERPALGSRRRAPPDDAALTGVSPEQRARLFLQGEINLAELYALSHEELYDIADQGQRFMDNDRLDEAEKLFDGLTALDPYNADFHAALGAVFQQQRRRDEALREYDRAIQLHHGHAAARTNRAELSIEDGHLESALADLTALIEADPEGEQPHSARARGLAQVVVKLLKQGIADQQG